MERVYVAYGRATKRVAMADKESGYALAMAGCGGSTSIDALPDHLISLILSQSRSARDLARAAAVCRRWRACAAEVPSLLLSFEEFGYDADYQEILEAYSKMLQRCRGLRELAVQGMACIEEAAIDDACGWLHRVSSSMECFDFEGKCFISDQILNALSMCPRLTRLEFLDSHGDDAPNFWSELLITPECLPLLRLRRCKLEYLDLHDRDLEGLVELCPSLEDLEVVLGYGMLSPTLNAPNLRRLRILSIKPPCGDGLANHLDHLNADYVPSIRCLRINSPMLSCLSIDGVEQVHADGSMLTEIIAGSYFRPVFKASPNLQTLKMARKGWTLGRVLEFFSMAKYARELAICVCLEEMQPIAFSYILDEFRKLRELHIGLDMIKALEVQDSTEPNLLRKVSVTSNCEDCITFLLRVLKFCALSTVQIHLMQRPINIFTTQLQKLQAKYNNVTFKVDWKKTPDFFYYEFEVL